MLKAEQVPDEAYRAWREAFFSDSGGRAAIAAAISAWPGMVLHPGTHISPACVWLPVADGGTVWVTQENPDAES